MGQNKGSRVSRVSDVDVNVCLRLRLRHRNKTTLGKEWTVLDSGDETRSCRAGICSNERRELRVVAKL